MSREEAPVGCNPGLRRATLGLELSVDYIVETFGISRPTVYRAVARGRLRAFRDGRSLVFDAAEVYAVFEHRGSVTLVARLRHR